MRKGVNFAVRQIENYDKQTDYNHNFMACGCNGHGRRQC